jgi:hypothetical protein
VKAAGKSSGKKGNPTTPMIHKTILIYMAALAIAATSILAGEGHKSGPFKGAKANTGYVTHTTESSNSVLTLSDDFKTPDAPDPHWQVVDSAGNTYLLQKLTIKGGMNRKITVPKYVPDIAKVQFWCAFAEVNLGEAAFEQPVK